MKKLTNPKRNTACVPPSSFKLSAIALVIATIPFSAIAEDTKTNVLDPIVVTATRNAEPLSQAAASIAVVSDQDLRQKGVQSFGEALLDIPNVTVESPTNPLFTKFLIRGSDDTQITYLIDGVRQDMSAMSGNHPIGIFIDPELIKQIEVKHGGGSALYGNGGIGGTLAVTTKTAADFLRPGENFGVYAKTGYATSNKEWMGSAYAYGRWNALDYIFGVTHRNSGDVKFSDGIREKVQRDTQQNSWFAKTTFTPNDNTTFGLAYNYDEYDTAYLYAGDPRQPEEYQYKQYRVTGTWDYENGPWVNVKTNLQYTKANYEVTQYIVNSPLEFPKGNSDDYYAWSGNIQNTANFSLAGSEHALTFGGDFSHSKQSSMAYNYWHPTPVPDTMRPDAKAYDYGLFLEDEIALGEYVTLAPVLRYSYYKREATTGDYPSQSDSKVTPSITLQVQPTSALSFWASVNEGYRPPLMDELYFSMKSMYPTMAPTEVIANPNLKPEQSWNYEIGMNANFAGLLTERDRLTVKTSLFYDRVKDFIGTEQGENPVTGAETYKPINYGKVTKKGLEISTKYVNGNFDASLAYGLVHAVDKETDQRISGITPQTVSLKLGYEIPHTDLHPWYRFNWYDVSDVDKVKNKASWKVKYGSFATHSVGLTWEPHIPNFWDFTAGLAVENLTNEKFRFVGDNNFSYARSLRVWVTGKF